MTSRRNSPARPTRRVFLQAAAASALMGSLPFAALAQGTSPKLKIGTIGSGRVGSALGGAWIRAGHEVMFSSLDLEADKKLAASLGPNARAGTTREAVTFGSVLLVSVPYTALPAIGKDLGDLLKGKIVIDTSNPIVARDGAMAVAAREKAPASCRRNFCRERASCARSTPSAPRAWEAPRATPSVSACRLRATTRKRSKL